MPPHTAESVRLQAVLFDMDGTLVDTEWVWWDTVESVACGLGYALGEADTPDVLGRSVEHTAGHLYRSTGGRAPAAHLAGELLREFADRVAAQVVPRPGSLELVDALREAGIPAALVSASPRAVLDTVLTTIGRHRFDVTVAVEDTPRTKPAPDPYLAAAAALGVPPRACVAVVHRGRGRLRGGGRLPDPGGAVADPRTGRARAAHHRRPRPRRPGAAPGPGGPGRRTATPDRLTHHPTTDQGPGRRRRPGPDPYCCAPTARESTRRRVTKGSALPCGPAPGFASPPLGRRPRVAPTLVRTAVSGLGELRAARAASAAALFREPVGLPPAEMGCRLRKQTADCGLGGVPGPQSARVRCGGSVSRER
ncbi:HAD family phosphatase [Streptomyces sp. NBC_01221]|uniref:HAD family hydrolase n=1 Tax=Streptomyces sp. NBC_01221 TaxID=2903782 RepID=UPI002B1E4CAD|nr:HAD family phosphatase [Streptomyces sp. NBC_01221]